MPQLGTPSQLPMRTHIHWILSVLMLVGVGCGGGGAGRGDDGAPTPPEQPVMKLFVLTGQSNSLGVTNGGELDPASGDDPADEHVEFLWHNVADASTSLGASGGVFTTLQDQQGGFYAGRATHWGPEVEMARSLYRAGMRDFGIIKASRGGGGNTNWSKAAGGHMYAHVVNTVTAAGAVLASDGVAYEVVGLLYLQGESDSAGEAAIADVRLSDLIANLRVDLPNAANLQALVGGVTAAGGSRDTVRAKQAALAASDPSVHYIDNLDMQPNLHDGLHLNKAAKITVGARFAQAVMDAGCHTPIHGNLVFIGDSITQGGIGYASYRYQVFRHLATNSASFSFVGSLTGVVAFADLSSLTPPVQGQSFSDMHDGHFGWRTFWINGRIPLPAGRRGHNVGEGTLLNWTGQASPQEYALDSPGNLVPYPDPAAIDTGSSGIPYTPDTAVVMIGINDLAEGSPPAQVRDDIGTIIDQLRGSNAAVRIHLCTVLHTNQANPTLQVNVDVLNGLLVDLAATKNAASAASPVWIADPSTGFDPALLTHDAVHPNTAGEVYIGERIARSLGLRGEALPVPPPDTERDIADFSDCFEGSAIYDGTQFVNGWTEVTPAATTEVLVGDLSDLRREHVSGSGAWLEGTATGWNATNNASWTLEARILVNAAPNGFFLWLGTDSNLVLIEVHDDGTRGFAGGFDAAHVNDDATFHTYRVAHDVANQRYHVWRDGDRLTPTAGSPYDLPNNESRLIFGDWTAGTDGDFYDVEIDYICFDHTGAYIPPGG